MASSTLSSEDEQESGINAASEKPLPECVVMGHHIRKPSDF